VLFHKEPSNVEVLNDLDFDVVNFFRVCQWHYEEFVRYLRYCLASRTLHELHVKTNPDTLTDIQRAGRFFYLQKNSFGGLILKQKVPLRRYAAIELQSRANPGSYRARAPALAARADRIPALRKDPRKVRPAHHALLPRPAVLERKLYKFTSVNPISRGWSGCSAACKESSFSRSMIDPRSGNCSRGSEWKGLSWPIQPNEICGPAIGVIDH